MVPPLFPVYQKQNVAAIKLRFKMFWEILEFSNFLVIYDRCVDKFTFTKSYLCVLVFICIYYLLTNTFIYKHVYLTYIYLQTGIRLVCTTPCWFNTCTFAVSTTPFIKPFMYAVWPDIKFKQKQKTFYQTLPDYIISIYCRVYFVLYLTSFFAKGCILSWQKKRRVVSLIPSQ